MRLAHNLPWMIWAIIILGLCIVPGRVIPDPLFPKIDKYVHLIMYLFLTLLMLHALWKQFPHRSSRTVTEIIVFSVAVAYGIIIEIVQETLIVTRSFEVEDILADSMGAGLGLACWYVFMESRESLHQKG